jgi:flavorubredoxin
MTTGAEAAPRTTPVELVPGSLFRLGSTIELDGRVSWAPPALRAHQPINAYLVLDDGEATMIDTGLACREREIVEQLEQALPPHTPLTVFLTRAEYEGIGNVGAVYEAVGIDHLYAGGFPNIFDAYNEIAGFVRTWESRTFMDRVPTGESIGVGRGHRLQVLAAPLRVLTCFWVYDRETRTLFTTDIFGHTALDSPDAPAVLDSLDQDPSTYESVREHVHAKFTWLTTGGDTRLISQNLVKIFGEHEIETIAPIHGCILRGKPLVEKHYEFLKSILAEAWELYR